MSPTHTRTNFDAGPAATTAEPSLEDDSDEPLIERGFAALDEAKTGLQRQVAQNLAAGAVMLLVTLLIILLAALVGGEFAGAIPSESVFGGAIETMTDNAGTAFTIFGVSLLAIPAVSVLAYIVARLGPFIGGGFGGGTSRMMRRRE